METFSKLLKIPKKEEAKAEFIQVLNPHVFFFQTHTKKLAIFIKIQKLHSWASISEK